MEKKRRCPFCREPITVEDRDYNWMLLVSTAVGNALGWCIALGIMSLVMLLLWYR